MFARLKSYYPWFGSEWVWDGNGGVWTIKPAA